MKVIGLLYLFIFLGLLPAYAQDEVSADEEMARKLNDPLAYIHALLTENDMNISESGSPNTYSIKLQPVWAINFEKAGFSLIPRAVIPINSATRVNPNGSNEQVWGLSDVVFQLWYAPKTSGSWKLGFGPQFSFESRQEAELAGLGNGIGISGVLTGDITPQLALAAIVGNTWSYDGTKSVASIQPFLFYNFPSLPGTYIGYNQAITINWSTPKKSKTIGSTSRKASSRSSMRPAMRSRAVRASSRSPIPK